MKPITTAKLSLMMLLEFFIWWSWSADEIELLIKY